MSYELSQASLSARVLQEHSEFAQYTLEGKSLADMRWNSIQLYSRGIV